MVVLAEDELSAASASVEKASSEKKEFSALMIVKKMPQDLTNEVSEDKIFFLPMILADIGFHNEAKKLLDFFNNSKNEE